MVQDIERMLEKLVDAEERTSAALKDTMRSVFHSFGEQSVLPLSVCDCQVL